MTIELISKVLPFYIYTNIFFYNIIFRKIDYKDQNTKIAIQKYLSETYLLNYKQL